MPLWLPCYTYVNVKRVKPFLGVNVQTHIGNKLRKMSDLKIKKYLIFEKSEVKKRLIFHFSVIMSLALLSVCSSRRRRIWVRGGRGWRWRQRKGWSHRSTQALWNRTALLLILIRFRSCSLISELTRWHSRIYVHQLDAWGLSIGEFEGWRGM